MFVSLVPGGAIVLRVLESGRQVFHRVGPRSQNCRQFRHAQNYINRANAVQVRKRTSARSSKEPAKV